VLMLYCIMSFVMAIVYYVEFSINYF